MRPGARSLNIIAHATHEGLKIEYTPVERLDANIYLVSRAYDTLHEALWEGPFDGDMRAHLTEAAEQVERCLETLARERQEHRAGRAPMEREP